MKYKKHLYYLNIRLYYKFIIILAFYWVIKYIYINPYYNYSFIININ